MITKSLTVVKKHFNKLIKQISDFMLASTEQISPLSICQVSPIPGLRYYAFFDISY